MILPPHELSLAERLALAPDSEREAFLNSLTDDESAALQYDWDFWARPKQLPPPGIWTFWLILSGRGFGKTRALCEWVNIKATTMPGSRGILAGATAGDVRDILIEGESGILNIGHPSERPKYEPSKMRLTWKNGSTAALRSADEPERFRGLQGHWAAIDELGSWRYMQMTWDMLMFGMRLGENPQIAIATTPRPLPLIISLVKKHQANPREVILVKGSSYENRSNLAASYIKTVIAPYEGTRLGRQELYAEILTDTPGALWKRETIELYRVLQHPTLVRIIVAIDPAATSHETSNETGIIVAGIGKDGHGYVLDDVSLRGSPTEWAGQAIAAYHKYDADRIVAETNNGGDMIETVIRSVDKTVSFKQVHASRGKQTRAEPVSALYEQGKVHHVGLFGQLEDQLTTWTPGDTSPDRLDSVVWALSDLMLSWTGTPPKPLGYSGMKARAGRVRR